MNSLAKKSSIKNTKKKKQKCVVLKFTNISIK